MRKYEEPSMDIMLISENIITTSNGGIGGNEGGFDYYGIEEQEL